VPVEVQQVQVESLFLLLEDVRKERRNLKDRLSQMNQIRSKARQLELDNHRLNRRVYALLGACVALFSGLVWMILAR
jgi:cell shape-determining protein MreC